MFALAVALPWLLHISLGALVLGRSMLRHASWQLDILVAHIKLRGVSARTRVPDIGVSFLSAGWRATTCSWR